MQKAAIIFITLIVGAAVLVESGIIDALMVFLLSGSLPGTSITLSPNVMMFVLVAASWLAINRMTSFTLASPRTIRRLAKRYLHKQDRMPKRRYSRI